jgi:hypothetical protein
MRRARVRRHHGVIRAWQRRFSIGWSVAGGSDQVACGGVGVVLEHITLHPQLDDLLPQPDQLGPLGLAQLRLTVVSGPTHLAAPVAQRALVDT